jgi:sialic acid synthase SpsE
MTKTIEQIPTIVIGKRKVGPHEPVYIIAEIGTNHDGSIDRAKELVSKSAAAGADAVKFQSWIPEKLHNVKDKTAEGELVESKVIPILERYALPRQWHAELAAECTRLGVDFLSTPFDVETSRFLRSVGAPAIKISSSDLVYDELLEEAGSYGIPVLLSTGMATLGEIERALLKIGHENVVLFHCIAMYPPIFEEANLNVIKTLSRAFGLPVGFSDHFPGHEIDVAAVALGARSIEKHVTLSRTDGAPDSFYALEMAEFEAMVKGIRQLEAALGDGKKRCMPCEAGGLVGGRRCLYAARDLKAGDILTREDVAVVRPNIGELKPGHLPAVIGRRIRSNVPCGTALKWAYLES